jgi:proline iminopeptidase
MSLRNLKMTVPTLVIGAKHDTMDPKHMEWMSKEVQNGHFLLCPNGSHLHNMMIKNLKG